MNSDKRIPTRSGGPLTYSPFEALDARQVPPSPPEPSRPPPSSPASPPRKGRRGRVDLIRQKAHRGGKTVTVVTNFTGTSHQEKLELARRMRKAVGVGGTVKDGSIEIQGDQREQAARILEESGYRPVWAGG